MECGGEMPPRKSTAGSQPKLCSAECRRLSKYRYYKQWKRDNRQRELAKVLVRSREHRAKNPDYFKTHYAKNRERIKLRVRAWYKANREKAQQQQKVYSAQNPETIRRCAFKAAHKRRALVRDAFIEIVDRVVVYERDRGVCGICKKPVERDSKWEVDHVIPLSKGGAHSYDNVQLSHRSCNRIKRAVVPLGQPTLFQVA